MAKYSPIKPVVHFFGIFYFRALSSTLLIGLYSFFINLIRYHLFIDILIYIIY